MEVFRRNLTSNGGVEHQLCSILASFIYFFAKIKKLFRLIS